MSKKKRRVLPVTAHLRTPCPDCGARYRGNELRHELSCPLMNSVEDVCDEDARWFVEHPTTTEYTRPITRAEAEQLRHTDPTAAAATRVVVRNCRYGRLRTFVNEESEPLGIMLDLGAA